MEKNSNCFKESLIYNNDYDISKLLYVQRKLDQYENDKTKTSNILSKLSIKEKNNLIQLYNNQIEDLNNSINNYKKKIIKEMKKI